MAPLILLVPMRQRFPTGTPIARNQAQAVLILHLDGSAEISIDHLLRLNRWFIDHP
jgi:hypothetical protein